MARKINFDKEQALYKAMCLFWEKGYTASSIQQLLDTMSINRGSMYSSFGDKRSLFLKSMELYDRIIMDSIISLFTDSDDPIKSIHDFFKIYFLDMTKEQLGLGCFLVNTIVEMSDIDAELVETASAKTRRHEDAIKNALVRAKKMGQIDKGKDPKAIARYLISFIKGLRVTVKENQEKEILRDIINTGLMVLN